MLRCGGDGGGIQPSEWNPQSMCRYGYQNTPKLRRYHDGAVAPPPRVAALAPWEGHGSQAEKAHRQPHSTPLRLGVYSSLSFISPLSLSRSRLVPGLSFSPPRALVGAAAVGRGERRTRPYCSLRRHCLLSRFVHPTSSIFCCRLLLHAADYSEPVCILHSSLRRATGA